MYVFKTMNTRAEIWGKSSQQKGSTESKFSCHSLLWDLKFFLISSAIKCQAGQSLTRGQKVQSRREREILKKSQISRREEKSEIPYPSFEKRKRNLQKGSPLSRREREMEILFSSF